MAACAGLCSGSNYLHQPLIASIADAYGVSGSVAAATVALAQIAYVLGLVLVAPAGDILERRRLIVTLMLLAAGGLLLAGFAPSLVVFFAGVLCTGVCAVAAQVLVALVATLAEPENRAARVGVVMSGLLVGILCARTVSGVLSDLGGWQTAYRVVALVMVLASAALWRTLPRVPVGRPDQGWASTVGSLVQVARAFPRLRTRALLGGVTFAGASLVLSTMALRLTAPPFELTDAQTGLVSLVGVAGALLANVVGPAVDRGRARQVNIACLVALLAAWLLFATAGAHLLVVFVLAMVLLDMGLQGIHVSNQAIIQALSDTARTRVTSVYMTGYFLGAASGSTVASVLWPFAGWTGVCVAGFVFLALAAMALRLDSRTASTSPADVGSRPQAPRAAP